MAADKNSRVAFLGIGAMGLPMAANLLAAGYQLTAWNRTREKTAPLSLQGAEIASDPASAAAQAGILVLMLESGPVVDEVLFSSGVAENLAPGSTVIDMSSIPPDLAREHAERLAAIEVAYIDAPASGGTSGAARGDLVLFVGGDGDVVERCMPILQVFGSPTHMGPAGSGQATKLVNQVIVGVTIGAVVEGLRLGHVLGLDLKLIHKALQGGFADSRIMREHGERIISGDFSPGAAIRIQTKDLRTAIDAAGSGSLSLPTSQQLLTEYEELESRGHAELDHSALWLWYGT